MGLDGSPTDLIKSGKTALDIANLLSEGLRDGEIYPAEVIKPRFTCKCSMEKVKSAVVLLGWRSPGLPPSFRDLNFEDPKP